MPLRYWLLLAAVGLAWMDGAAAQQKLSPDSRLLYSFGDIEIHKITPNKSYQMRVWTKGPYPASFGFQCHTTDRGYVVYLDPPLRLVDKIANPQTFTIWSDGAGPVDVSMLTRNGGAIAMDAEGTSQDIRQQVQQIIEILGRGQKFFAFSTAGYTATFDLTHMPAARKRFSELCTSPFE